MTSWKAERAGTAGSVSWAAAGTAAAIRARAIARDRLRFIDSSWVVGPKGDYNRTGSDFELPGVDPLFLEHRPEVLGQALQDIGVRQPAVALIPPPPSPRIAA